MSIAKEPMLVRREALLNEMFRRGMALRRESRLLQKAAAQILDFAYDHGKQRIGEALEKSYKAIDTVEEAIEIVNNLNFDLGMGELSPKRKAYRRKLRNEKRQNPTKDS